MLEIYTEYRFDLTQRGRMTGIAKVAIAANQLSFIEDTAADEDAFGAHDRVARAIAGVITAHAQIKVIGLLGPWGSGKSTVVRLLGNHLPEEAPKRTYIFTYDAWLHQSDPPKRSFLERLIGYLDNHKLITAADWQEDLDVLNRRIEDTKTISSPRLTASGWLVLLSLVLVPAGTRMIGADWYKVMMAADASWLEKLVFPAGFLLIAAPAIVMGLVWVALRQHRSPFTVKFWKKENWSKYRKGHEGTSLLALFLNKQTVEETKRTIKTPEPTTLEFQNQFRKLIVAASGEDQRLVIVIDNLDRLEPADAIEMWTTIRSFLLGALEEGVTLPRAKLPTVILPVDEMAVGRMFSGPSKGDAITRSFLDKTFDLTFYVTPPVSSDWQAYLASQMARVFGNQFEDDWSFQVGRIYSRTLDARFAVTPRDINKLVNAIAALWLQWADSGVPMGSIAYFVIHRAKIEEDINKAVAQPALDLSDQDPEWARSLAALRFGVLPVDALQVLLGNRLALALARGSVTSLNDAAKVKGFENVLHRLLDDLPDEQGALASAISVLARAKLEEAPWLTSAWRKLRRAFLVGDLLEDSNASSLDLLVAHCPVDHRKLFLSDVATHIASHDRVALLGGRGGEPLARLIEAVWQQAVVIDMDLPEIRVPGSAAQYLDVASTLVAKFGNRMPLKTAHNGDQLVNAFSAGLSGKEIAPRPEARARLVLDGPAPKNWEVAIDAADFALRDSKATQSISAAAALVIGCLSTWDEKARAKLMALAADGQLEQQVSQAVADGNVELVARFVALMLATHTLLGSANGESWTTFTNISTGFPEMVEAEFRAFAPPSFVTHLVAQAVADPATAALVTPLLTRRAIDRDMGRLHVKEIVNDVESYLRWMPEQAQRAFIAKLPDYQNFWQHLSEARLSASAVRIYQMLFAPGGAGANDRKRARKQFLDFLKTINREEWRSIIYNSDAIIDAATLSKVPGKGSTALPVDFFRALSDMLPNLLGEGERPYASSWTAAVCLLSASNRRTIMANFRDQLLALSSVPELPLLLSITGNLLLSDGKLEERGDEVVRRLVVPLIESHAGRTWLVKHRAELGSLVHASSDDTRTHLNDQLKGWSKAADLSESERLAPVLSFWAYPKSPKK